MASDFTFTYEVSAPCGCAKAYLSDGVQEVYLYPSHMQFEPSLGDPLLYLMSALLDTFRYETTTLSKWHGSPGCEWQLKREGDLLHVTLSGLWSYSKEQGWEEHTFSLTCNLWKFLAKVRLACSRAIANETLNEGYRQQFSNASAYQALCELLEGRKGERKGN